MKNYLLIIAFLFCTKVVFSKSCCTFVEQTKTYTDVFFKQVQNNRSSYWKAKWCKSTNLFKSSTSFVCSDLPLFIIHPSILSKMQTNEVKEVVYAEIQVQYTMPAKPVRLGNSRAIYKFLKQVWDTNLILLQHQVFVLYLNAQQQLLGYRMVSSGSESGCKIHNKLIVGMAVKTMATHVVLAHNPTNGVLKPGKADIMNSNKIKEMLDVFGVTLSDHLIVSPHNYYSFSDAGIIYDEEYVLPGKIV